MTTPSTPTPPTGALVDAPVVHHDGLTDLQRQGAACCWCAEAADRRFPVRMMAGVDLSSCAPCAGMYGVAAAEPEAGQPPAMAADGMSVDRQAIRRACEAALSGGRPRPADAMDQLVAHLEGHVRLLAPEVAARVPAMDESMRAVGLLVLGHADKALEPAPSAADCQARLHDLGVVARALLALVEMTEAPEPPAPSEPADATGWLVTVRPQ